MYRRAVLSSLCAGHPECCCNAHHAADPSLMQFTKRSGRLFLCPDSWPIRECRRSCADAWQTANGRSPLSPSCASAIFQSTGVMAFSFGFTTDDVGSDDESKPQAASIAKQQTPSVDHQVPVCSHKLDDLVGKTLVLLHKFFNSKGLPSMPPPLLVG